MRAGVFTEKMLEVQRAIFTQTLLKNPFLSQMYIRSATEMWVSAFNQLKITNTLDKVKTINLL